MAANDELSSNGVEPVSQMRSPCVLEFYDPAVYLAAAYPVAVDAPAVVESEARAEAAVADARGLVDRSQERSRRVAQALAEVHSTARERGLLKAPSAQLPVPAPADSHAAGVFGDDDDAPASDRLTNVANWLTREGDISGLFLLDEKGYSLLPEGEGSVGDDVALHDLGLRLAAVLDLVPQRLERSVGLFQSEAPIARVTLDGGRSLAVMRVAPEGALLAWIEVSSMPLSASLAKLAKSRFTAILTGNEESKTAQSVAAAGSDAP